MATLQEFFSFLEGRRYAPTTVFGAFLGIVLCVLVGGRLKSAGLYTALSLALVCAQTLVFLACRWGWTFLCFALAAEGVLFGFLYGALFAYLFVKEKLRDRKARRSAYKHQLQFVLPDKDNAYLRDRLHTALRVVESGKDGQQLSADKESVDVRLRYARRMVAQLKGVSLSTIERLDMEEMATTLTFMERKGRWSTSEIKMINEIFSCLLKLSAKYEVAI